MMIKNLANGLYGKLAQKKRRIYIAGPMTGYENLNYQAFHDCAQTLRNAGYEVISPAEINPESMEYREAMRNDIRELIECDAIWMLPGWPQSKGANLEFQIALILGLEIKGTL